MIFKYIPLHGTGFHLKYLLSPVFLILQLALVIIFCSFQLNIKML